MLSEWGLDPVYINGNWTTELFALMIRKFGERKEMMAEAMNSASSGGANNQDEIISDKALFSMLGVTPNRTKYAGARLKQKGE
ncbi:hypothetical protein LCGC14_2903990 [marine sediment metagenome]|uniref:Uncharacterized protein n=1 Tax=marine sediment metagenome TaxID=412755 RepID=A0A0F8YFI2_9ZZZZ